MPHSNPFELSLAIPSRLPIVLVALGLVGMAAWLLLGHHPMIRKLATAALAATTVVLLAGSVGLGAQTGSDHQRPDVARLPVPDGKTSVLTDFKGKPTVVNLWATWCPPCQREMPVLQQAQAEHPEFHFLFLNQGETAGTVRAFITALGLPLRNVMLDPNGEASAEFGHGALPTTPFFDAQGRLLGAHRGELSRATLAQGLEKLNPPSGPTGASTPAR